MVPAFQPITVLLADPSDVSRFGLRSLLQADRRFAVIGDVPIDVVGAAQRLQPDLIVLDPAAHGEVGLRIIDELHRLSRESRLVVLTAAFEPHAFMAAMLRQVHGYLLKDGGGQGALILDTLALIARFGCVVVDAEIAEHFWALPGTPIAVHVQEPARLSLSEREHEVLHQLLQGLNHNEVAAALGIMHGTVDTHVSNICRKLGVRGPVQLGAIASALGIS
jgi:DNA-binding NarL/FixJ family response regulator